MLHDKPLQPAIVNLEVKTGCSRKSLQHYSKMYLQMDASRQTNYRKFNQLRICK